MPIALLYRGRPWRARVGRGALQAIVAFTLLASAAQAQYTLTTIAAFDGENGDAPQCTLAMDTSGNLYGTTEYGGTNDFGTVFRIAAGSHTLTTLFEFDGTHGSNPHAGLIVDANGNLYGTTQYGGANGLGAVFKVAAGSSSVTTLASFDGALHGSNPISRLVADATGNLYGTAQNGGANSFGTVFKVAAGSNAFTTLASFDGTPHGSNPYAGLVIDGSGNLYGTTQYGGALGLGVVFKVDAGTNTLTRLASLDGTAHGSNSYADLVRDASGNLFGTAFFGGAIGYGSAFKVAAGTNFLTTLHSFNDIKGSNLTGGLLLDAAGNLYGMTKYGNSLGGPMYDHGTVFKIAAGTNTLTTLAEFSGMNGSHPYAGLIADTQGNLYGTTSEGGAYGLGTVFVLSPPKASDFDGSGVVDNADLGIWRSGFGTLSGASRMQGDADGDGDVDGSDFLVWQRQLGSGSAAQASQTAIPEPNCQITAITLLLALCSVRLRARSGGSAGA